MNEHQRVRNVVRWLIFKGYAENETQLARLLNYGKSGFSQLLNGKVHLSDNFINKLCSVDININRNWIVDGSGEMLKDGSDVAQLPGIPLIPIESISTFKPLNYTKDDKLMYVIPEFNQKGADFAIRITGNEMYPKYTSGDILVCRKISEAPILDGKTYILETSQRIYLKRIFPHEDENFILCISENKEEYPSFKLLKSEIKGYSIVLGLIHIE